MNAGGMNLQRWAGARGSTVLNLVGVGLSASCGLVDMASFAFAPQSLLAPFGALTLIINLLLAAPLHGDAVRREDLLSTALVFAGVAVCLSNSSTDDISRTYDNLLELCGRKPFHAWVAFLVCGIALAACRLLTAPAGSAVACYPLMSGCLGGFTALSAKYLGELGKAGAPWEVMAMVGTCVPLFAVSQLTLLNAGLARASSLLIVPVFVAAFVTCNAIGGGIFFDEFAAFSPMQQRLYPLGLALLVGGVLILAGRKEPEKDA